jgi:hypothetical protein
MEERDQKTSASNISFARKESNTTREALAT